MKTVRPGTDVTSIVASMRVASSDAMASPSPLPEALPPRRVEALEEMFLVLLGNPRAAVHDLEHRATVRSWTETAIGVPGGVCRIAFSTKTRAICCTRTSSPSA